METKSLPQILIVSGACCSPNLIRQDQMLEKALGQAVSDLGLSVEIQKVSLSHVLHGSGHLTPKQDQQILALFQTYNTRFTPALFLGDEVLFAGNVPSMEQVKEALGKFS
jgi:hypothetical protein